MSSFGEELRRERELRQITLREVSEATKINLRYLDALEQNDFTHLPGGVFNKGFVRAYAQYIGVDPEAMVNAYLLEEKAQVETRNGDLSPDLFRPSNAAGPLPQDEPEKDDGRTRKRLVGVVIVAALAVAVVLAVLTVWWLRGRSASPSREAPAETAPQEVSPVVPPAGDPSAEDAEAVDLAGPALSLAEPEEDRPTPERENESDDAPTGPPVARPEAADRQPSSTAPVQEIRVVVRRPTEGRLNCDNRRVEILDGMAEGTEILLRCRDYLLIDARDAGALLVAAGAVKATPLGPDGTPVVGHRVSPSGNPTGESGEAP